MTIDMKLAEKGRRQPRLGLLDQGRYHLQLEIKYRGALHAAGWRPMHTNELTELVDFLDTQHAEAIEARADSRGNRRREQEAIDDCKACKRKLVHAFTDLYEDGIVTPEDLDIVKKSGPLGRSTPKISAYLADIRKPVAKYDAALRGFFGESALAMVDRVKADLDEAQGAQEAGLASLPHETLKIYEAKGRLLASIEKMNRIAKIAFDGQAHIIGEFNKDLLRRARTKRRAASTVEPIADMPMTDDKGCEETG